MLNVSEDIYQKTLEEQAEYERLLAVSRRKELSFMLGLRTWLSGVGSLVCLVLGFSPRFRPLLFAGLAVLPLFAWQLACLVRKDRYLDHRLKAEADERRLAWLHDRHGIRQNLMEQKKAQDEIDRLRAEIQEMKAQEAKKGAESS